MFFESASGLIRVAAGSVIAYSAVLIVLRLAGKRALAKLNAFDFVITVAFGSTLATLVLSKQVALLEGMLAFVMLALLQWIVSRLSVALPWFSRAIRSVPVLLAVDGSYCQRNMEKERVTISEVDSAVRKAGVSRIEDVAAVVLETDGSMSVLVRGPADPTILSGVRR